MIRWRRVAFLASLVFFASLTVINAVQSLASHQLIDEQEAYTVTVTYGSEAQLPDDVSLSAREIIQTDSDYQKYKGQAVDHLSVKDEKIADAHFFDIKLLVNGTELQPQAPVSVSIKFNHKLTSNIKAVHFGSKIESVEPEESSQNSTVSFEAKSFSVYGIIELPTIDDAYSQGWHTVGNLETLDALISKDIGFYIAQRSGFYMMDELVDINNNGSRYGIKKTKPKTSNVESAITQGAVPYYFEKVSDGHYRAYFYNANHEKQYIKQSTNSLLIVSNQSEATVFEIIPSTTHDNNFVIVGSDQYCWNMQRGENGSSIAAYQGTTDENAMMRFEYKIEGYDEIAEISGKSFGIVRYDKNVTSNYYGAALMATPHSTNSSNLDAKQVEGKIEHLNFFEDYFVVENSSMNLWEFEYVDNGQYNGYHIGSMVGGVKKYLSYVDNGSNSYSLVLVDEPDEHSLIWFNLGSGDHAGMFNLQFSETSLYVNLQNNAYTNGFRCSMGGPSESAWLYLTNPISEDDYTFKSFSAKKTSVSEIVNGQDVVIYTRLWSDKEKKYNFYAIDHDGSLVRVYDNGEDISYVSTNDNTVTWKFTEYYYDDSTPNYYYDFKNNYSNKYLAPQLTDNQKLSDSPIGVIMNGRRYGDYYSKILAWDFSYYDYVGFSVNESDGLTPVRMSLSNDFYFAIVEEQSTDGLTVAETIDNNLFGITMKMIDYNNEKINNRDSLQMAVMGGEESNQPMQNLLYRNLDSNGYPVATLTDRSLSELFGDATEVNHLLMKNTYEESGYFEYDSTQNYAYLGDNSNFKVYNQIGSYQSSAPSNSLKHGQFYPYNDLQEGFFTSFNNTYDIHSKLLSDRDPRKDEKLYAVSTQDIDFHFGMEINAPFMQGANGKDFWGHDISFEFSGDDDMWLYIDGILIIDLGGVHSAQDASVNFSTGEVKNNGTQTTIRELFRLSYLERYPSASESEITEWLDGIFKDGGSAFKDYTTHTMKMFYMERGGNASNLHMRFNLAPVVEGRVEVAKLLDGTDKQDYASSVFPFQIFYKNPGDEDFSQVQTSDRMVFYKESGQEVISTNVPEYGDVFWLKPDQHIYINFESDGTEYYIRECDVDTRLYDQAIVNGISTSQIAVDEHMVNYQNSKSTVFDRRLVTFVNHVDPDALRTLTITKRLFAKDGTTELQSVDTSNVNTYDDSLFNFRLYLGEELDYYRLGAYHVKDPNGNYCTYDSTTQRFVSTGVSNYENFSEEQKILVTFTTSPSGAVSNIPAGYSIEIRNLLPETKFKVIERDSEIPEGYTRVGYERVDGSYIIEDASNPNAGVIKYEQSATMDVNNKVSNTLKVQKIWTDDAFMKSHGVIYFAVFNGSDSTPIAIRQMTASERSVQFNLNNTSGDFSNYHTKEVALVNPIVDADGNVTSYDAMTILDGANNNLTVAATYKGETESKNYDYKVSYNEGEVEGRWQNNRTDTVTNDRVDGIRLYKTDKDGSPLENAIFKITDDSNNVIGNESYTSDTNGLIGKVYLKENATYHIQELTAPNGYTILPASIDIITNATGSGVVLSGEGAAEVASVSTTTNENDTVTIINTKFHLPETGGSGITIINLLAAAFLIPPLIYLGYYYAHKRKRRRAMVYK